MAVNAFVGHSFLPNDREVVGKILNFFDHVSSLGLDFSWDHAEGAEPKELSIKVKEKMEGKNLFIGICTSRQKSIDYDKLKPFPLNKKMFWGNGMDFATKTSDWILQEIGFAYGRDMKIMILLEDGVKAPGGIQGDIEYISFERENPERSFNKILEMLHSLVVPFVTSEVTEITDSEKPGQPKASLSQDELKQEKPVSEWTKNDYEFQQFVSFVDKDDEKEEEIHNKFINSDFANDQAYLASWNARRLYLKMDWKKENNLDQLLDLIKASPENEDVVYYVARSYELYGEHEQAAIYYEKSSTVTKDLEEKIHRLSLASLAYAKSGRKDRALTLISECVSMVRKLEKGSTFIYRSLADLSKELDLMDDYKIFTEAYLETAPEDHSRRFSLAYKYSQDGEYSSALFHYRFLSERGSDSTYWNNLGAALASLKLPALSVAAYRRAEKMSSTLAMSNLANKFISEGFLDEAMELAKKATAIENYDERIGYAINKVREIKENEEKEHTQFIENFKQTRKFYIDYADACLKENLQAISRNWKGTKCPLMLSITDDKFEAIGEYEKTKMPAWGTSPGQKAETVKVYVKYTGKIRGRTIKYKYWSSEGSVVSTVAEPKGSGLMIVQDGKRSIRVCESTSKDKTDFSEMTVIGESDVSQE